jgi:hypothetical protein
MTMTHLELQNKSPAELIAIIAAMRESNKGKLSLKVTTPREAKGDDKGSSGGAISVYGLGRFPTTLYRSQWERLLDEADTIRAFIAANADKLATKA